MNHFEHKHPSFLLVEEVTESLQTVKSKFFSFKVFVKQNNE